MDWTEVIVNVEAGFAETAADILQMASNGIYIEDYRNIEESVYEIANTDLIDEELLARDKEHVVFHIYYNAFENISEKICYIKERLDSSRISYEIQTSDIQDTDWANNWKKYYKPFEVGKRLLIKPEWEEIAYTGRVVLSIDPGLAFGTGTHESTKMCLELLDDIITGGENVLDVGCGSGILSVAAILLGAMSACAIDIDPLAVRSAAQNGALNNIKEDRLTVIEGDLVDKLRHEKFDIVMANIVADAIIKLSPPVTFFIKKGGKFICSGIIDEKLESVKASLTESGFTIERVCQMNGWAAVLSSYGSANSY